ncbi:MAG TPA: efflux RND transporter periplasmic adaptor subunit, partial [Pirellulales bacterium]|nr:efflux RND transporter periplasmic adaptor subunit [Pirellulales bacterium]
MKPSRTVVSVVAAIAVVAAVVALKPWSRMRSALASESAPAEAKASGKDLLALAAGRKDSLNISEEDLKTLDIHMYEVRPAPPPEPIRLPGSVFLDPGRMVRAHSRFDGEVVKIGTTTETAGEPLGRPKARARLLRFGDKVHKGEVLAVVWSKDVGEKKSELIDALSKLSIDYSMLQRYRAVAKGTVPERTIHEADRLYEGDLVAVDRAERTLRSWRLTEDEIAAVHREARDIQQQAGNQDKNLGKSWAETEVRSPIDGVIVEKNFNVGDIVANSQDLFKIADLSHVQVFASAYEEDLAVIKALPPERRHWLIDLKSDPNDIPVPGKIDVIGNIIDPTQHSGAVMGGLDNADGRLSIGQFVTATIQLPPDPSLVAVPTSALIEDGMGGVVFVEVGRAGHVFARRKVVVVRRGRELAYIRSHPNPQEALAGAEGLLAGQRVIVS